MSRAFGVRGFFACTMYPAAVALLIGCSNNAAAPVQPVTPAAQPTAAKPAMSPATSVTNAAGKIGASALAAPKDDAGMMEDRLGVKFYPGAKFVTKNETPDKLSATLAAADSIEKVVAFYQKEMPQLTLSGDPGNAWFEGKSGTSKLRISAVPITDGGTTISITLSK